MKLTIATAADSKELTEFYQSYPILGPIDLSVQRVANYFQHYRLQSDDFETHCLRERDGSLQGTATLLFREGRVGSSFETIGYATDLRISNNRKAIVTWTEHFLPITQAALEKRNSRFLFSVISGVDPTIQNTLIRPRAQRRNIPVYHLLRRFEIVTLAGHWPLMYDELPSIKLSRASESDIEPIAAYLRKQSERYVMSFSYSADLIADRLKRWLGFQIDAFILAKDKKGNIVGTVAPWNNQHIQKLVPIKYSGLVQTAGTALKMASWLKWATPLPPLNTPLQLEFLTHLHANNSDVFACLLEEAYRQKSKNSFLAYAHFHKHAMTLPPRQFIYSQTPSAIYTLSPTNEDLPRELFNSVPELELCLV